MRGDWDAAETAAEIAGESVSATVASRLAAAGLLTAVGRGKLEFAGKRATELRDSHPADDQVVMLLGQAGAEAALWRGDGATAAQRVDDALARLDELFPHQLGGIMLVGAGDRRPRRAGDERAGRREHDLAAARELVARAEETAENGAPRACTLGPEGLAWLHRARAELTRFTGPDPAAWCAVIEAFGYELPEDGPGGYRQAYARLRRAEATAAPAGPRTTEVVAMICAPPGGGRPGSARAAGRRPWRRWPCARACGSTTRRPRSGPAADRAHARGSGRCSRWWPTGAPTARSGAELYISEKTVSVHLSRVMAKLGAGSRTEAVTIAYARGLLDPRVLT